MHLLYIYAHIFIDYESLCIIFIVTFILYYCTYKYGKLETGGALLVQVQSLQNQRADGLCSGSSLGPKAGGERCPSSEISQPESVTLPSLAVLFCPGPQWTGSAHSRWERQADLLSPPIQILISSRKTPAKPHPEQYSVKYLGALWPSKVSTED